MSSAGAAATEPDRDPECPFCGIVSGSIPATVVHESERTVAFRDLNPQAPTHVLVIPRRHAADLAALAAAEPADVTAIADAVADIALSEGLGEGYRVVFNTGARAGQTVFHVHAHVLGGRDLSWPPG
jgi:histidine triad (HIT) family protein